MSLPRLVIPTADDGVIDKNDIELGVYVIIPKYSNAEKGDTIILYWGSSHYTLTIVDLQQDFPMVFKINQEDLLTEGYLSVFYAVVDPAHNSSFSTATDIVICTECTTPQNLPPIYIKNAEEDKWLNLKEVNDANGVVLYINANPVFKIDDQIRIFWQEKYSDGSPVIDSDVITTISITEDNIGQRLSVLIPLKKVMLASNGVMTANYTLFSLSRSVRFSDSVSANFNFSSEEILPAPIILHQDNHGQVSMENILLYQGVRITIPASNFLLVGDEINIYWQGYTSEGGELPQTARHIKTIYSGQGDTDIHIPVEYVSPITDGTGRVYYSVSHDDHVNISPEDTTHISFNSTCDLLPPDISDVIEHELTYTQISQFGGVELNINGEGLIPGDTLNIYSCAYDENGMYISSLFFSAQHVLSQDDVQLGFKFLIPKSYYANEPGYHYSIEISSSIQLTCGAFNYFNLTKEGTAVGDKLYASTGYYPWGKNTLQECYVEYNSGKPDVSIVMMLIGEGYFISNHTQKIKVNTDRHGIARAHISSENSGTNQIIVEDPDGETYGISLTANNLSTNSTPWFERTEYTGPESDTQTFYAHIDIESGHFLLKTSSGTIMIGGKDCGNIVYNYEIVHSASQHFEVRSMDRFTVSLCDLSGHVFCACSL